MQRKIIETSDAPSAIGTYSQAVKVGTAVYLSGQIPLHPDTMEPVEGGIDEQIRQVFANLRAVARAAGGDLADAVKLTIYLTDLSVFPRVNEIMAEFFQAPYPARATVEVSALPKGLMVEIDAILVLAD